MPQNYKNSIGTFFSPSWQGSEDKILNQALLLGAMATLLHLFSTTNPSALPSVVLLHSNQSIKLAENILEQLSKLHYSTGWQCILQEICKYKYSLKTSLRKTL